MLQSIQLKNIIGGLNTIGEELGLSALGFLVEINQFRVYCGH